MIELLDLADSIRAAEGDETKKAAAMLAAPPATREQYTAAHVAYAEFAAVDRLYRMVRTGEGVSVIESASPQARADLLWVLEERDPLDAAMRCRELRLRYL